MSYTKDPDATLDWTFDWGPWLTTGEVLSTAAVTVPTDTGAIVKATTETVDPDGTVTVWLRGGTAGKSYDVVCRVTTNQGRTDERTIRIRVDNR